MKWFDDKPKAQTRFPFVTEFGGKWITVTGLHYSGLAYETDGYGLISLSCVPVEAVQEMPRAAPESTVAAPQETWVRQGFFKDGPQAARRAAMARNGRTRNYREWLETALSEPRPAAEVFMLAAAEGIPVKGLKRAKKRLKVVSVRTGGLAWRGSWVWRFPAA